MDNVPIVTYINSSNTVIKHQLVPHLQTTKIPLLLNQKNQFNKL